MDTPQQSATGATVSGWAIDPDSKSAVSVTVVINGKPTVNASANVARSTAALPSAYRGYGGSHGFRVAITHAAGTIRVCVLAHNIGAGSSAAIGCLSYTVNFDPHGTMSLAQAPAAIRVTGTASDPNTTGAVPTRYYLGGKVVASGSATGSGHGYAVSLPEQANGPQRVCVVAVNVGPGSDHTIGCQTITLNFNPSGAITALSAAPGGVRVTGWSADPDTTKATGVIVTYGTTHLYQGTANSSAVSGHAGHSFSASMSINGGRFTPGTYQICATGVNAAGTPGGNANLGCTSVSLNSNPTVAITSIAQNRTGATISGWAQDPDTSAPIKVQLVSTAGAVLNTVTASGTGSTHSGHNFTGTVTVNSNGVHKLCAVAVNVDYGSGNSAPVCALVSLNFNPFGSYDSAGRTSTGGAKVTGWAIDPNTSSSLSIQAAIGGKIVATATANATRTDVARAYPSYGTAHGFSMNVPIGSGETTVCLTAVNISFGANTSLGCKVINAAKPTAPGAVRSLSGTASYGSVSLSWSAPSSDGGAPVQHYTITSSPASSSVQTTSTSATISGLKPGTTYTFTVAAVNVAGTGAKATTVKITVPSSPPPQTTAAPVSTSRYVRNVSSASSSDVNAMKAEGAADAAANPTAHRYLQLLDIGGQDETDGGVVLSAGVRFVSYPNLVTDLNAYVDGYASKQRSGAPTVIAIGTNNDMDVSASSGANWANAVVDKVAAHAAKYSGITIAGADDMEPGFTASYAQSKAWLQGFLGATTAQFVFNGSADGCEWTKTAGSCNNGWTEADLYYLAAGASPSRIVNLPQVYNDTMAEQWKYISLTGLGQKQSKINFGGPLTEYTACQQAGGCSSLTGHNAWNALWSQLQSSASLKPSTLPFSTDLRIDS